MWPCRALLSQSMLHPRAAVLEMCRVVRSGGAFGISISKGWWWEEDPRWNWHATLLDGLGVVFEDAPPSSGEQFVDQLLFDMPLSPSKRSREVLEFEFEDAETFWTWCWSHGWRGVMERLTAEQLDGYRKGICESIGDGRMPGQLVANLSDRCPQIVQVTCGHNRRRTGHSRGVIAGGDCRYSAKPGPRSSDGSGRGSAGPAKSERTMRLVLRCPLTRTSRGTQPRRRPSVNRKL